MIEITFAENLKRIRDQKGYSGKDFAELLNISYPTYMSYENKGREPKYELLIKIASILEVSIEELLGIEKEDDFTKSKKLLEKFGIYSDIMKISHDAGKTIVDSDEIWIDYLPPEKQRNYKCAALTRMNLDKFLNDVKSILNAAELEAEKKRVEILGFLIQNIFYKKIVSTYQKSLEFAVKDKDIQRLERLIKHHPEGLNISGINFPNKEIEEFIKETSLLK